MRQRGVVLAVVEELNKRDIVMSYDVCKLVIELALGVIIAETSRGGEVALQRFGIFRPHLIHRRGGSFWKVTIKRGTHWRRLCRIKKGESPMEKYGVETDRKDPKTKEASEQGRCPICGAELSGSPGVCPKHGSEPFERRTDGAEEEG